MLKPFSMIFFILVMVWMGGIFLTSDTNTRIERACSPATVADKVVVAMVQLVYEPWALDAHRMMLQMEYGCRFTVWKTFYEDVLDHSATTQPAAAPKAAGSVGHQRTVGDAAKSSPVAGGVEKKPVLVQDVVVSSTSKKTAGEAKPLPHYMDSQ